MVAYDQDLHVHHKNYASLGHERDSDLEALCKRCHELKSFGATLLHKPEAIECIYCGCLTWNLVQRWCDDCKAVDLLASPGDGSMRRPLTHPQLGGPFPGQPWESIIANISSTIKRDQYFAYLEEDYLRQRTERETLGVEEYDKSNEWEEP